MRIRDATHGDFPQILALNQDSVHVLSPLDEARLAHLHRQSVHHRVAETHGGVVAFLLALDDAADYDSPNYQWFRARSTGFLYVDRIVVAAAERGRGLGRLLYVELFGIATLRGYREVTCEVDLHPPNPASAAFHRSFGFSEVGRQRVADGAKLVSLQAVGLPRRPR